MNTNSTHIWIATATVLLLVSGCGKSEYPTTPATDQSSGPVKAEQTAKVAGDSTPPSSPSQSTPQIKPEPLPQQPAQPPVDAPPAESSVASAKIAETTPPTNNSPAPALTEAPKVVPISQDQATRALQEALGKGLQQAITRLGHEGGFLTNLSVKIPMPESLTKVESALRAIKQDKLVDDFVVTMNRAAEQAVPQAANVFATAVQQMTIEDAKAILTGPDDAATQYFRRTTETNLYAKFLPVVQSATKQTGVTAAYKTLVEKAKGAGGLTQKLGSLGTAVSGSLLGSESLDIDAYVTQKAMDGLFKMVGEEEKQIRNNPLARTTDLLQKVFGGLKK